MGPLDIAPLPVSAILELTNTVKILVRCSIPIFIRKLILWRLPKLDGSTENGKMNPFAFVIEDPAFLYQTVTFGLDMNVLESCL
jgi:hypothetical protein